MMNHKHQVKIRARLNSIGVALVLGLLVVLVSLSVSAVVVNFPDPGLEAAIRDAIGKQTGDIHDIDLIWLTGLDARDRDISNLEGIQRCFNLTELNLEDNAIVDISPLIDLANLTYLSMDISQRGNVEALDGLANTQIWLLKYWTPREGTTYFFAPKVIIEAYRLHLYNISGALVYERERTSLDDLLYVDNNSYRALLANEPYAFMLSVKVNDQWQYAAPRSSSGLLILR